VKGIVRGIGFQGKLELFLKNRGCKDTCGMFIFNKKKFKRISNLHNMSIFGSGDLFPMQAFIPNRTRTLDQRYR
jgi:hypothetical protein